MKTTHPSKVCDSFVAKEPETPGKIETSVGSEPSKDTKSPTEPEIKPGWLSEFVRLRVTLK
jgi:hypothetical protein